MNTRPLWQITVTVAGEAEDAVGQMMERLFERPTTVYSPEETRTSRISVFCERQSEWNAARRQSLVSELHQIEACGLCSGPIDIAVKKLKPVDWTEAWRSHFRPIEVGPALLVKPSWSNRQPRKAQEVVVLDPGLSFGTGQHPTTLFCLQQLVESRLPSRPQSFLDIGTGSGILAIAAAKLGYAPVDAIDLDLEAIRIAGLNALKNQVQARISLRRQDLTKLPLKSLGRYNVVCANLIFDLLLQESQRIVKSLAPQGTLILAGILGDQFDEVRRHYQEKGLKLVMDSADEEWRSGSFIFNSG
ncbi:MAG: 50S ribosomal protein L11 methyltransferase [Verrucomicrobiota bacterium]